MPFVTGDEIFYESTGATFNQFGEGDNILTAGISTGSYFIEVLGGQQIKLYSSRSFINGGTGLELDYPKNNAGVAIGATHTFTLYSQRSKKIQPKKSFKKFPLSPNLESGGVDETIPGTIGKLINGVEIFNYKSNDKIYFGPLTKLNVLSGGSEYDVINPPILHIEDGVGAGTSNVGTGATGVCNITGSLKRIDIIDKGFDYISSSGNPTVSIFGGEGDGAEAKCNLSSVTHRIKFNTAEEYSDVNLNENTIGFSTYHKLRPQEKVVYKSVDQTVVGGLIDRSIYFVGIVDEKTIKLHTSYKDAVIGINTVDFYWKW